MIIIFMGRKKTPYQAARTIPVFLFPPGHFNILCIPNPHEISTDDDDKRYVKILKKKKKKLKTENYYIITDIIL